VAAPRSSQRNQNGPITMPEIDIEQFSKMPPNDLEARRRAIVTKANGQHDNLTIDELHELAAITGVLRRRASGPPKAAKTPRNAKPAKPQLEDLA
jgi:hypothetical protein